MKVVLLLLTLFLSTSFSQSPVELWGGCTTEMTVKVIKELYPGGTVTNEHYSKSDYTRYTLTNKDIGGYDHYVKFQFDSLTNKLSFIKIEATQPSKYSFESTLKLLLSKYGNPIISKPGSASWIINGTEINLYYIMLRTLTSQGIIYKPAKDTGLL